MSKLLEVNERKILDCNVIHIGRIARLVKERMTLDGLERVNEFFYESIELWSEQDKKTETDIVLMVIDAREISSENFRNINSLTKASTLILFSIGKYENPDIKLKLMNQTRCFFFKEKDGIEKYIASIIQDFLKALSGEAIVSMDLADVQAIISKPNNIIWYGRSFGKNKGAIIAKQLLSCKWLLNIMNSNHPNFLVIASGDLSLEDCSQAITPISAGDEGASIMSIRYEGEPYEEMTLLLMGSY